MNIIYIIIEKIQSFLKRKNQPKLIPAEPERISEYIQTQKQSEFKNGLKVKSIFTKKQSQIETLIFDGDGLGIKGKLTI